ncbi:metallophosphoesterase family protein [Paraburkholderia acidiphila]|uniref:Metallophosphoesterase n=1 Tax=Paraburkholderia acidiphila TaxID=2571747 RepID=A0A7Z2GBV9_9BURK|nr:metallophosphoesterase [Paraburkholderia acidiphila]QGZ58931.1 metallophosphoesterase [Paraburkholderia acidiphila]
MSTTPTTAANPAPMPPPVQAPTPSEPQSLQTRLRNALNTIETSAAVPPEQKRMIGLLLSQAQTQATDLLSGDTTASPVHHVLSNVNSLLDNATVLQTPDGRLVATTVSDEGDLVGTAKYESLDMGWAEAAACWLEHIPPGKKATFSNAPQTITIPNSVSIAIAGDWGTGVDYRTDGQQAPAGKIADRIRSLSPTYTIHLGDVYYAGTSPEENENFLAAWPSGSAGSFTLNSNHDMYSGGNGYFNSTLADASFHLQKGCSYFALQNDNWLIIGLDTAYYANQMQLYQNGWLDAQQCAFLQQTLDNAKHCRTILLTHHNGLSTDGATLCGLWGQIAPLFSDREVWWYWGHQHAGAVYIDHGNVHPRCCGHGAIPAGAPTQLDSSPSAIWHENREVPDLLYPGRVYNGFVFLTIDGNSPLKEAFIDEDGTQVYPPPPAH